VQSRWVCVVRSSNYLNSALRNDGGVAANKGLGGMTQGVHDRGTWLPVLVCLERHRGALE